MRTAALLASVFLLGCIPQPKLTGSFKTQAVKRVIPDKLQQGTWVMIERHETSFNYATKGSGGPSRREAYDEGQEEVISKRSMQELWLCHPASESSRPQCYRAQFNKDDGPERKSRESQMKGKPEPMPTPKGLEP